MVNSKVSGIAKLLVAILIFDTIVFARSNETFAATAEEEILIAQTVYAEANNQSEMGKRLVADTILNRVEDENFPNSIKEVIFQPGQYAVKTITPTENILLIVKQEIADRTNGEALWFRTKRFHTFGDPLCTEGEHYFSGKKKSAVVMVSSSEVEAEAEAEAE